ncbi:uncharacterized protein [Primulina eburnea]|uniref:uncharacterized protein n=1 Tax=Primulina eburnea TaxID=1245227 RepID=UPI003C6BDED0
MSTVWRILVPHPLPLDPATVPGLCVANHSSHSVPTVSITDPRALFNPNSPPEVSSQSLVELVRSQGVPHSDPHSFISPSIGDVLHFPGRRAESCDGIDLDGEIRDTDMSHVNKRLTDSGDFQPKKNRRRARGLRNTKSEQRLHALIQLKRVQILAILEPMSVLDPSSMTRRLGFHGVVSNVSNQIWVFFSEDVTVELVVDHEQFLHLKLSAPFLPSDVFCSFVYAKCDYIERRHLWDSLIQVKPASGPWLVGGDFNVVRESLECLVSSEGRLLPMGEFNSFILDSGLIDAGFEGSSFTWTNKTIWKRLDRVLVSAGMPRLFAKLKRLKNHLKWWNRDVFGNIFDNIIQAEKAVKLAEAACETNPSTLHWTRLSECNAQLAETIAMEEDFWKQKAACKWLEDGERNTKLFHNMVKKKRVTNKIFRIWDNGTCLTSPALIQQSGAAFFENLLTGNPSAWDRPVFHDFSPVISDLENNCLVALPTLEEVRATVFSIHRDSAAGPDGYSSAFFQHCWEIIHQDVFAAVLDFFCGSPMLQSFTATTITLIPKVDGAQAWTDFRPISLCNVTNKIISKLLYSRLSKVVGKLISPNQSGFVPGRVISDNILLAQELTHSLGLPSRGGNVILKLDMAKAYDRVQWPFLLSVLRHLGFSEPVVSLVSACISHCKFSVNINGTPAGFFASTRGLRQGDPLSPLLFIIGAEYLSRGLNSLFLRHPGLKFRSGCDTLISHLAYADVIIIFANGGARGMRCIKEFLWHYENCSGQLVNVAKSAIILPPRSPECLRTCLLRITGFAEGQLPLKYLGVPLFRGNRKSTLFEPLLMSVRKKLEGWESRTLSPGSRMTLLRSVLLSMPINLFQVIQPPLAVIEKLELIFNGFLWGSRTLEKKWHWARWSRACLPTQEGGLGCRRLKDLVDSFSVKLWFRFRQGASLWARFLLQKYCRLDHPASVPLRGSISPTCRRLLQIRARAEPDIRWRVGSGDVSFWDDIWFGDTPLSDQSVVRGPRAARVSSFLSEGTWDFNSLCSVVPPSIATEITLIPVTAGESDVARWTHSANGVFLLKSAWEQIRMRAPVSDIFTPFWGRCLRPTISFFLWRLWHRWLPVDEVLQSRGISLGSKCQCYAMPETFCHIFLDGPVARSVWHFFGAVFRVQIPHTSDFLLFLSSWKRNMAWTPGGHMKEFLPFIILWFLWTVRNDAKHRRRPISGETVKHHILSYIRLAHSASLVKPKLWLGFSQAAGLLGVSVILRPVLKMTIVRWLRPPPGVFKLNVDGSSRGSPGDSSVGGVVRDSSGRVALSFSEFIGVGTNVRAELWAVWRGLLLFSDLSLFPLWIETDSLISIQIIRYRQCQWRFDHIVSRIHCLLRGRSVHMTHIFREGNSVADALATVAHSLRRYNVEFSSFLPRHISMLARSDSTGLPYLRSRSFL